MWRPVNPVLAASRARLKRAWHWSMVLRVGSAWTGPTMRLVLKILIGLCLVVVVAVAALLWRLDRGPVSIAFAQPLLQGVIDRYSPYAVSFAEPELIWLRREGDVALQARDVEVRTHEGKLIAAAPLVRATVALSPLLLERRAELTELRLDLPSIELTRDADGRFSLSFDRRIAAIPLGDTAGSGGPGKLLGENGEVNDPLLAGLRLVRIAAPSLQFEDAATGDRATAADAAFQLDREGSLWRASLSGKLGDGTVAAAAEPTSTPARPDITLQVERLRPKDFVAFAPTIPLADLNLPVSGTVRFSVDGPGASVGAATFDLTMGEGTIAASSLGLEPIPIKQGELRATLASGWTSADIERLQLTAPGYSLGLSGKAGMIDGELQANIVLDATELDVDEILQLWPTGVAGDARKWIATNIPAGQLSALTFQIDERGSRPDQLKLGGSFSFAKAQVRFIDTLPPARDVSGSASLAGDSLAVKVAAGRVDEIRLRQSTVTLSNLMGEGVSQLQVKADLQSSIPAAMLLLDREPVELGKATGLSADRTSGQQASRLEVGLPLLDKIPPEKIRYKVDAQLTDLQLREAAPGYDVAARSLAVMAEPQGIGVKGDLQVNTVPLSVDFRENTPPVRGVKRTVKLSGALDAAAGRALRFEWPEIVGGSVGVDADIVEATNPLRTIDVALNLDRAAIHVPELVLSTRPGERGTATARLVQRDENSLAIEGARIEVANSLVEGDVSLRLDPVRPEVITVRRLRMPLGDLTADLRLDGNRWRGRVDIGRLDLRPMLQADGGSGGSSATIPDFSVQVTANQLRLGDAPFTGLSATVVRRGGIWNGATARANVEDSEVRLDVNTTDRETGATLRSTDAGWFIRALSPSDNGVRGGTFRLSANLFQGGPQLTGSGDLKIRNFTMWGAPMIARIVSLASFTGLSNALSGQGVPVQRLVVPFRLDGETLTLEQARLVGSNIGARADGTIDFGTDRLSINGTVAPAYTVNRVLGRIPVIGQILSGSGSDAALAATFRVNGSMSSPQISVNPLAALVPGMIRDLFSAFTADNDQGSSADER